jgi:rhodanese-related sulfurtransferase
MNLRRFLAEAGTLVGLAVACALVSNALAGKERRLALPGDYPNATRVAARGEAPPLAPFQVEEAVPPAPSPGTGAATPAPAPDPAALPAAKPFPTARPATVPPGAAPAATPAAELLRRFPPHGQPWAEISGDAAAWLHGHGVLFLDARRSKDFALGHVTGARSFPVWEAELVRERVEALVGEGRDGSLPVVLYCSGGDCEDSHMLAQTLFGAGFENLLVYRDGFPDWVKRGGAVSAGGPS